MSELEQEQYITTDFLKKLHPFLTDEQAKELLEFCKKHTIYHKGCYGNGSIMLPKYLASEVQ